MYAQPVLFPAVSNRETWLQTVQIADDETGDLIALTDDNGVPLYAVYLDIMPERRLGSYGSDYSSFYDDCGGASISASLNDYLSIPDTGTIQIQVPYTVMATLHGGRTYDVFLRLEDAANSDARQLLIGRLPVAFGGRRT